MSARGECPLWVWLQFHNASCWRTHSRESASEREIQRAHYVFALGEAFIADQAHPVNVNAIIAELLEET